jgi:hypothetical protein
MVGRYGGRRSQMREHQKLCKLLAYTLRTVTHIPDPWDLNLYYGITVTVTD